MTEKLLQFRNLKLTSYETVHFFHSFTRTPLWIEALDIAEGELVGIIGESGAGKSLLAEVIVGGLATNIDMSGDLFYKGKRLDNPLRQIHRGKEWFYVPQSTLSLNPLLRMEAQLKVFGERLPEDIWQTVGLQEEDLQKYPHELSGGMKKKMLFLFAMMQQRELLIADEPTRGLDSASVTIIEQALCRQHRAGATCLIISHDFEWLLGIAQRIIVMRDGGVVEHFVVDDMHDMAQRHPYTQQLWHSQPQRTFIEGRI
ncbi:ATP-binding cassette domain-containing protein [Aerococcaceae bacterium NML201209]|nr:ATP-binding cassette domain-containing protein [Aerococcaceae bacterium NML201209]MCW6666599.1 ATP-binding cassette domain-containing protein [Aerococcaceae bacterium NML190938]MCW6679847.1 ATP-binding cassette domain-containing protein [Aerococcaceae bacterium NML130460]